MAKTTNELIDEWFDIEEQFEFEVEDEKIKQLSLKQQELMSHLMDKVDNIDLFIMRINEEIAVFEAKKDVYAKEVERIRKRIDSRSKLKKYLNGVLIPTIINTIGKDGKLQTSSANYTLYSGWGKMIYDPDKVQEKYKYTEIIEKIDTVQLKKDAIAVQKEGQYVIGVIVPKEDRIRRT